MALIGWQELILILAILMLIFGATRIKDLAKALGESVRVFKKSSETPPDRIEDANEDIIKAAEKMGIKTEGKDIKQILGEMEEKSAEKKAEKKS